MAKIVIVGLGPGHVEGISLGALNKLKTSKHVYLRTCKHPIVEKLPLWNISFQSLDHFYHHSNFEDVYNQICDHLLSEAKKYEEIVYAVPGSPLVAEDTVELLKIKSQEKNIEIEVSPALSFLDVIYPLIELDPTDGLQIVNAVKNLSLINPRLPVLICQIYNKLIASEVKLTLMESYPDEFKIKVIRAAGVQELEKIKEIPLYQLDHLDWIDYLTTVYIPPLETGFLHSCNYPLDPLVVVMNKLLSPNGCPWDRKQTHISLKRYLLEETYEVLEAIDEGNMYKLCEELGDLLLQVVFHAALASQEDIFTINDVIIEITEKMVRRHPHVFADVKVSGTQDVIKNWEAIKAQEKGKEVSEDLLGSVPKDLPALMHAYKIQEKAAKVGFDWPHISGAWEKVYEELNELEDAVGKNGKIYDELGDVLFAVVNVARFLKINPEEALLATIRKFRTRFKFIEDKVKENGKNIKDYSLEELDKWWEQSKKIR
ncbi:MAG: tetrapyrrole methylase family protein / MazG family protein [Clostridia bacterium]|jgi:tetrapyrrole methylase family protein/MazG family protein|nr:tetrapyrrole methylase family protein / MazG family protein [Clostridia bacterium]MDN5321650.1 tetrapyrrole methylase family protein / MazG family protein [Clostridia bacterium]